MSSSDDRGVIPPTVPASLEERPPRRAPESGAGSHAPKFLLLVVLLVAAWMGWMFLG